MLLPSGWRPGFLHKGESGFSASGAPSGRFPWRFRPERIRQNKASVRASGEGTSWKISSLKIRQKCFSAKDASGNISPDWPLHTMAASCSPRAAVPSGATASTMKSAPRSARQAEKSSSSQASCPPPPIRRCSKERLWPGKKMWGSLSLWAADRSWTAARPFP